MTIYGYARLVGYDEKLQLQPDILESFDQSRTTASSPSSCATGHKWSDGQPLTTEDFRYAWEDVMLNEDLQSGGLPRGAAGRRQAAEIRDRRHAHGALRWDAPNPDFLPELAAPQPLSLVCRRTT